MESTTFNYSSQMEPISIAPFPSSPDHLTQPDESLAKYISFIEFVGKEKKIRIFDFLFIMICRNRIVMCNNSKSDCSSASQSDSHQPMDQQQQQLYDHLLRTIAISVQAACMLVALLLAFLVFRYRKYKVLLLLQRALCCCWKTGN